MGAQPDWYPTLKAARYLGVPPWTLLGYDRPTGFETLYWRDRALIAQAAEAEAEAQANKPTQ